MAGKFKKNGTGLIGESVDGGVIPSNASDDEMGLYSRRRQVPAPVQGEDAVPLQSRTEEVGGDDHAFPLDGTGRTHFKVWKRGGILQVEAQISVCGQMQMIVSYLQFGTGIGVGQRKESSAGGRASQGFREIIVSRKDVANAGQHLVEVVVLTAVKDEFHIQNPGK